MKCNKCLIQTQNDKNRHFAVKDKKLIKKQNKFELKHMLIITISGINIGKNNKRTEFLPQTLMF